MLKYVAKFTIDILPSVVATIIGAYIVNHYIVVKPDAPVAAAVSTAEPKKAEPANVANLPEAGVKAKGISEKSLVEKTAAEKPAAVERPAETASLPAETHRHPPALREKALAKAVQTPSPSQNPVPAATSSTASAEPVVGPEEKRDANDLARAAIERLRVAPEPQPHLQEAVRNPEASHIPDAPRLAAAPAVQPLPPPIMVSAPSTDAFNPATGSVTMKPPATPANPRRLTPPADIPSSQPIDLHAEAALPPPRERTSVADDVLSAAKSVFHAVLPR